MNKLGEFILRVFIDRTAFLADEGKRVDPDNTLLCIRKTESVSVCREVRETTSNNVLLVMKAPEKHSQLCQAASGLVRL